MMKTRILLIASLLGISTTLFASAYPDSVRAASDAERRIEKGLTLEFAGGVGIGRSEFKQLGANFTSPHVQNSIVFPTWNGSFGLNEYFLPWMGIGTGVQFSTYANTSRVALPWVQTATDYEGHGYVLTSTPLNMVEQQGIYMIEVPLALRFRAIKDNVGFQSAIGAKLGLPIYDYYRTDGKGGLHNEIYYEHWDLTYSNIPGVIEDATIKASNGSMGNRLRTLNYAAYAEIGMLFRLHQRLDLSLSLAATYYFNNVLNTSSVAKLGFADSFITGEYPAPFTESYSSVLLTDEVQELHPWSLALKLGLSINCGRTHAQRAYQKEQREQEKERRAREKQRREIEEQLLPQEGDLAQTPTDTYEERPVDEREVIRQQIIMLAAENGISLCDLCSVPPVVVHDTIYVTIKDTVTVEKPTDSVVALDEALHSSVIWFHLDDTVPILEPQDILEQIAEILRRHPDQQIYVNGHACVLGRPAYNKKLALRRATAVAEILRKLGVRDEQMQIRSLGADEPFRYEGRHQLNKDRRVEIIPIEQDMMSAESLPTVEVVLNGSRLVQIARRMYGNPDYWVFIYDANRAKIADPNNIPAGTELYIPDIRPRLKGLTPEEIQQEIDKIKNR